jgi:hypothetical protein
MPLCLHRDINLWTAGCAGDDLHISRDFFRRVKCETPNDAVSAAVCLEITGDPARILGRGCRHVSREN